MTKHEVLAITELSKANIPLSQLTLDSYAAPQNVSKKSFTQRKTSINGFWNVFSPDLEARYDPPVRRANNRLGRCAVVATKIIVEVTTVRLAQVRETRINEIGKDFAAASIIANRITR